MNKIILLSILILQTAITINSDNQKDLESFLTKNNQRNYIHQTSNSTIIIDSQYSFSKSKTINPIFNNNAFSYVFSTIELYKFFNDYITYKKWLKNLSYCEFCITFSYLLSVEKQIKNIQNLLSINENGTFPEKIAARINLVKTSLSCPYDKVANECAKKYYDANFDKNGHFIWHKNDGIDKHYKSFYKKVPKNFKELANCSKKFSTNITDIYISEITKKTDNDYNQTLLDIIYTNINQNFPMLKKLCRKYHDELIEKLYKYYINNKQNSFEKNELINKNLPATIYNNLKEEYVLQEWYEQEMFQWLFPDNINDTTLIEIMHNAISQVQVLDLPTNPDYRFVLLKKLIENICLGNKTRPDIFYKIFRPNGILKQYLSKETKSYSCLNDPLIHQATNFALAIREKENDNMTQIITNRLLEYILCLQKTEQSEMLIIYKNKIMILYKELSIKKYYPTLLDV